MHKEKIKELVLKGVIGFIIGFILSTQVFGDVIFIVHICCGLVFAGFPYCWGITGNIMGNMIGTNFFVIFMFYGLRFVISYLIGWIVYPVVLIYHIVKYFVEERNGKTV